MEQNILGLKNVLMPVFTGTDLGTDLGFSNKGKVPMPGPWPCSSYLRVNTKLFWLSFFLKQEFQKAD